MNKRQVIILWVIAAVLAAGVAVVKLNHDDASHSTTERKSGDTLFKSFPGEQVATVEIAGAGSDVTITKKDGKWVIPNRDSYPANSTYVNEFIRTLNDLKVTRALEAGPSLAARFGMDESATSAEQRGLTATFKDASGTAIAKVSLGKSIESDKQDEESSMFGGGSLGRYVRNGADESGIYAVKEMFPSVTADPKRWLSDTFIAPEKIKSIAVTKAGKSDVVWKLVRDSETAEFKIEGSAPTENLDAAVATSMKSLFSYARFEDVVPADKVASRALPESKQVLTLETFEGVTYQITLTATKPVEQPPAALAASPTEEPPATDNYFVTIEVSSNLPKERTKVDGEKPEDAKAKDAAFVEQQKSLTERLEKEKALAGRTFEIRKSVIEAVLKDREALVAKAAPPAAAGGPESPVQMLPGGSIARPHGATAATPPVEAVTPPVSVPAEGEEEEQH